MTTPPSSPPIGTSPSPIDAPSVASRRDRCRSAIPLASLLTLIAVMWLGAAWADSYPSDDVDSWGFVFAAFVLTFLYAPLPLLGALVTAAVGAFSSRPSVVRVATVTGAVVAALCGLAALGTGVTVAWGGAAGDRAFGIALMVGGVVAASTVLLLRRPVRR